MFIRTTRKVLTSAVQFIREDEHRLPQKKICPVNDLLILHHQKKLLSSGGLKGEL